MAILSLTRAAFPPHLSLTHLSFLSLFVTAVTAKTQLRHFQYQLPQGEVLLPHVGVFSGDGLRCRVCSRGHNLPFMVLFDVWRLHLLKPNILIVLYLHSSLMKIMCVLSVGVSVRHGKISFLRKNGKDARSLLRCIRVFPCFL